MTASSFKTSAVAALAVLMATPAMATDVTVKDFIGRIIIETGDTKLAVKRENDMLDTDVTFDKIAIDGGYSDLDDENVCNSKGGWIVNWSIDGKHSVDKRIKSYPELMINVPDGSRLFVKNSHVQLINKSDLSEADLKLSGCLSTELGNVENAKIQKSGSGNIEADRIGSLDLSKSGSGDLEVASVGTGNLSVSGSGDIDLGEVDGTMDIRKSGSGDIEIERMTGNLSIRKSGSGDIEVDAGSIPRLTIEKSGSGEADVDADVTDAKVTSRGSGDVYLKRVSGQLESSTSGSGDLDIGSRSAR